MNQTFNFNKFSGGRNLSDSILNQTGSGNMLKTPIKPEPLNPLANIKPLFIDSNAKGKPRFDFEEFPVGYFSENPRAKDLRKQLIKNEIKVSQEDLGTLETVFFSKENIALINKQLILKVYERSNKQFLICNQKEENLIVVMRYFYLEYARHLPYNIKDQIRELNCMVVGEILPTIITNADQKVGYLRDISTQPVGPPLPINTKNIGRTLPSISNIIHMKDNKTSVLNYQETKQESNIQGFPDFQY